MALSLYLMSGESIILCSSRYTHTQTHTHTTIVSSFSTVGSVAKPTVVAGQYDTTLQQYTYHDVRIGILTSQR